MRISDWSSDVCSSDLYEYVGENVSYFSTLSAASNAARQVGAHGRGFDGTFSSADLEQLKQVDGGHYLVNVDHPLVLPVGKKIRFLITGNDVIHAWWVPDFAVKKDAIPGYINERSEEHTSELQSLMRISYAV